MSFAAGFAKGLAGGLNDKREEINEKQKAQRERAWQMFTQVGIPLHLENKKKSDKYNQTRDAVLSHYDHLTKEQANRVTQDADGDLETALSFAARARMENAADEEQKNIERQVEALRQGKPSQSTTQPSQAPQGMGNSEQAQTPSVSGSVASTGGSGEELGWAQRNILGMENTGNIQNEVAREIAGSLGMDEESFQGFMQQAMAGYSGFENTADVSYEAGLTSGQERVIKNLAQRAQQGQWSGTPEEEAEFYKAVANDDIGTVLGLANRFMNDKDLEAYKQALKDAGDSDDRQEIKAGLSNAAFDQAMTGIFPDNINMVDGQLKVLGLDKAGTQLYKDVLQRMSEVEAYLYNSDQPYSANRVASQVIKEYNDGNFQFGQNPYDGGQSSQTSRQTDTNTEQPTESGSQESDTDSETDTGGLSDMDNEYGVSAKEMAQLVREQNALADEPEKLAQFYNRIEERFGGMNNFIQLFEKMGGSVER